MFHITTPFTAAPLAAIRREILDEWLVFPPAPPSYNLTLRAAEDFCSCLNSDDLEESLFYFGDDEEEEEEKEEGEGGEKEEEEEEEENEDADEHCHDLQISFGRMAMSERNGEGERDWR